MHERGEIWCYEVDAGDIIVSVGPNWDSFALENEGPEACARHVLGRPWTDFVFGRDVRQLWITLIDKVRRSGLPVVVPMRCDGPSVRRFMKMNLIPKPDNALRFCSELLREEPCERLPILDRTVPRADTFLQLCSWCARINIYGEWHEIEDAAQKLRLFEDPRIPALNHGICPDCLDQIINLHGKL